MYEIRFARDVATDLRRMKAFHRARVLEAIETQLGSEPTAPSRNRKLLVNLVPPWSAPPPIWELRVADYRVFYDVSESDEVVYVRAIRRKPPGKRTQDIL